MEDHSKTIRLCGHALFRFLRILMRPRGCPKKIENTNTSMIKNTNNVQRFKNVEF